MSLPDLFTAYNIRLKVKIGWQSISIDEFLRAIRLSDEHLVNAETLYHRDDALLYIAYVMLIWAASIPADRWHCSLWP